MLIFLLHFLMAQPQPSGLTFLRLWGCLCEPHSAAREGPSSLRFPWNRLAPRSLISHAVWPVGTRAPLGSRHREALRLRVSGSPPNEAAAPPDSSRESGCRQGARVSPGTQGTNLPAERHSPRNLPGMSQEPVRKTAGSPWRRPVKRRRRRSGRRRAGSAGGWTGPGAWEHRARASLAARPACLPEARQPRPHTFLFLLFISANFQFSGTHH